MDKRPQRLAKNKTDLMPKNASCKRWDTPNRLKCKPHFVLFDSWYPSKKLLKRIRDYGWYFVCQLKKNRRFEGRPLVRYLQQPYWQATGSLSGGIKVFVVRYRRTYYATNRLT